MNRYEWADRYLDMRPHVDTLMHVAQGCHAILEWGVRGGCSTWALLDGLPQDGVLDSVDIRDEVKGWLPDRVKNDPRWTLIIGNDQAPEIIARYRPDYDFLFLDASHFYQETVTELEIAEKLNIPLIGMHDWLFLPEVKRAGLDFLQRGTYALSEVEESKWGLAFLRRV